VLVIGQRDAGANVVHGDYRFVLQGPIAGKSSQRQDEVVLAVEFTDELTALLTRARAAELLAQDNVHKKEMAKLAKTALDEFRKKYLAHLLTQGYVIHGGHRTEMAKMPTGRPLNTLADVVDHVKGAMLDNAFAEKYPKYPAFRTLVTAANVESEMTRALQSLDRAATQQLDLNTRGYLESFGAIQEGRFSASASEACRLILERIKANDEKGNVTALDDLVTEFGQSPWGLPNEIVHLLLGALLFNGYLIFIRHGGKRLHAGDVGPMLKQGLSFFEDIRYLEREGDIDVEGVVAVFEILDLQAGLVRDRDSRTEAVKVLRLRGQELRGELSNLRQGMQWVIAEAASFPDVPWLALQERLGHLSELEQATSTFADVSQVAALGRLDTSPTFRATLQERLDDLKTLNAFLHDWRDEQLSEGLRRMQKALQVLPNLEPLAGTDGRATIGGLQQIATDSRAILTDEAQLLQADYRRPLKGKNQQFHQKYDQLYYGLHNRLVGDSAPWQQLENLRQNPRYRALNRLKGLPFISTSEFNQIALDLQGLERHRCRQFDSQVLAQGFVSCPYCGFPEGSGSIADLPARLAAMETRLEELWERWQEQVFNELPVLADRLSLLARPHRDQIEALQRAGALPEEISDALLAALHELTSNLQPVELDLADLARALLSKGSALTADELRSGWDGYLTDLLRGHNPDLVRFKIVLANNRTDDDE
jgi:hypothetical protein